MARKRYKKDKRIDMRQGGRVQLKAGSMPKKIEEPKEIIQPEDLYPRGNTPNDHNLDIPLDFKKDPMPLRDPRVPSPSVGTPDPLPPLPKDILRDPAPAPEKERPQTVSISQPQPQAGNIFPEVQQDLQEKVQKQRDRSLSSGQPNLRVGQEQQQRWDTREEDSPYIDRRNIPEGYIVDPNTNTLIPDPGYFPPVEPEPVEVGGYGIGTAKTPSSAGFTGGRTPEEINRARAMIEGAARGELSDDATIPQPASVDETIAAGTMQMDPTRQAQAAPVLDPGQRIGYDPSTGQAVTGTTPERFTAGRYDARTITDQTPIVDPQTGDWSDYGIANMQSQALTKAAQGIDFTDEQKSRGITERVVGEMDAEAKMNAVKVAGTDLPRVLRAKKQLRRAGLTEEQINLIGDNPDLLEDELMDYTEEQRGMIAGLPDEALVSTQMNALLEGMESGEIPAFARPAVAAVNEMLMARGLDASTVGRDALFNAIIQSAMPLAQSNAQSIKESVFSQRNIEAQAEQMNAQMAQQRAMTNSERVFNLNMAQFSADQQRALSNSKFLQTTSITEVGNDQQAAIQEAVSMAQLDLATLDSKTKLTAQNAQTWLQRDVADLNNRQQAEVLTSQMRQQGLLSDQAAQNAAQQFNATSENQTNQFMSSMAANMEQFNKTQQNAMTQFNKTQENQAKALEEQAELDVAKYDAQLSTQIDQFNAQQEFAREQFNTQNAQAVEQANVAWRRQANTVNTAAINAVNQQNAQNAFGLSTQAMSFLWQELRDQMDYSFKAWDNDQQRKASLMVAALGNEGASYEGKNWTSNLQGMTTIMGNFLGGPGG